MVIRNEKIIALSGERLRRFWGGTKSIQLPKFVSGCVRDWDSTTTFGHEMTFFFLLLRHRSIEMITRAQVLLFFLAQLSSNVCTPVIPPLHFSSYFRGTKMGARSTLDRCLKKKLQCPPTFTCSLFSISIRTYTLQSKKNIYTYVGSLFPQERYSNVMNKSTQLNDIQFSFKKKNILRKENIVSLFSSDSLPTDKRVNGRGSLLCLKSTRL